VRTLLPGADFVLIVPGSRKMLDGADVVEAVAVALTDDAPRRRPPSRDGLGNGSGHRLSEQPPRLESVAGVDDDGRRQRDLVEQLPRILERRRETLRLVVGSGDVYIDDDGDGIEAVASGASAPVSEPLRSGRHRDPHRRRDQRSRTARRPLRGARSRRVSEVGGLAVSAPNAEQMIATMIWVCSSLSGGIGYRSSQSATASLRSSGQRYPLRSFTTCPRR
jgi:hypothetical protein